MAVTTIKVQLTDQRQSYFEPFTNINLTYLNAEASISIDDSKAKSYIRFVHGICCAYPPIRLIEGNLPDALINAYKETYGPVLDYVDNLEDHITSKAKPFLQSQSASEAEIIVDLQPPYLEEDDLFTGIEEEITEETEQEYSEDQELTIEESVTDPVVSKKGRKKQA